MKKAILLPMLCLIALCGCEKSTELSEITGNPETETPENGSLTFQLNADKTTCNLLDLTTFSISFNRTVSMWDISNQFDSIVWIVESSLIPYHGTAGKNLFMESLLLLSRRV